MAAIVNRNHDTPRYVLLFSTHVDQDAEEILQFYQLRFQIEFIFRDAKQFTGLSECQARNKKAIDFHFNTSLIALNLAKREARLQHSGTKDFVFSMNNIKRRAFKFKAWEENHLAGLCSHPGRGQKSSFTPEQKTQIKEWVKESPKNLNGVISKIKETWNITTSKDTIKRILKSLLMNWHRVRRVVFGEPDANEYAKKKQELEVLKEQAAAEEIDLRYFDESGFSLNSNSPYAWQDKADRHAVKSRRSQPFNVLGLMNIYGELDSYIFTGGTTSEVVIACIDSFSQSCTESTTIVMDQASIHTSNSIENKRLEWETKGIHIFWLPTYSPQLNLIEILWRFMKYE